MDGRKGQPAIVNRAPPAVCTQGTRSSSRGSPSFRIQITLPTGTTCRDACWDTDGVRAGRLTSEDATQDRLDIRSYIDTARKHGQDVLHVLHRLMPGDPWTPPAPAPA